jgi:hypothetical protein
MQRLLAVLSVTLLTVSVSVRAADQPTPAQPAKSVADQDLEKAKQQAAFEQARLQREFSAFQQKLLAMAQRYEKSAKTEEREKALVLRQAIELAAKEGVDNQFNKLVLTLTSSGITLNEINSAIGQNDQLTKTLREMIAILLTDNQSAKLKEEQLRLQDLLKKLEKLIREQKLERSKTESGRFEGDQLAKSQGKVTDDTRQLSKVMDGKDGKDGKGERDTKGEARGEGKNGKPLPEGKDDTKESKGDAKDGQGGEAKPNEPSDSQGKGGQPQDGQGEGKPQDGQGQGEGQGQGQPKDGQAEAKPNPSKPEGAKPTDPAENRSKPEGKGEGKPGEGQGDAKGQQGEPSQGQPGQGKGQPSQGGQPGQPGQPGEPGDGQPQQPQDGEEPTPGRERVKDAIENQDNAQNNLRKNDRKKASSEQDEAVQKLEAARKEIERRLKQLREEELERLLANLMSRCQKMLAMQTEVYDNTKRLHAAIEAYPDHKATRIEVQKAGEQSNREGEIVVEANKALQLLEEDGTAVAVPQVLEQARDYMGQVQSRLFKVDVGAFTQETEEEIISMLKEVIEALKRAQQEQQDRKNNPPPPPPGGQPPPQTLISLLAELKMIRSLQVRVNTRTVSYGKQYPGEQADDTDIQKELRNLAQRQDKIQKATKDIATGKVGGGGQ